MPPTRACIPTALAYSHSAAANTHPYCDGANVRSIRQRGVIVIGAEASEAARTSTASELRLGIGCSSKRVTLAVRRSTGSVSAQWRRRTTCEAALPWLRWPAQLPPSCDFGTARPIRRRDSEPRSRRVPRAGATAHSGRHPGPPSAARIPSVSAPPRQGVATTHCEVQERAQQALRSQGHSSTREPTAFARR